jgi:hypothetical protein
MKMLIVVTMMFQFQNFRKIGLARGRATLGSLQGNQSPPCGAGPGAGRRHDHRRGAGHHAVSRRSLSRNASAGRYAQGQGLGRYVGAIRRAGRLCGGHGRRAERLKGRAIAGPHGYEQIPALVDRSVLRVKNFLTDLNERLEHASFVAGEQFSAADITALVTIDFAQALDISAPEGRRALTRWYDAVSARPSMGA